VNIENISDKSFGLMMPTPQLYKAPEIFPAIIQSVNKAEFSALNKSKTAYFIDAYISSNLKPFYRHEAIVTDPKIKIVESGVLGIKSLFADVFNKNRFDLRGLKNAGRNNFDKSSFIKSILAKK